MDRPGLVKKIEKKKFEIKNIENILLWVPRGIIPYTKVFTNLLTCQKGSPNPPSTMENNRLTKNQGCETIYS